MPMKKMIIMLRLFQWSPSQPAGSEHAPNAINPPIDSVSSSEYDRPSFRAHGQHDGREDQHEQVVERVAEIEERDGERRVRHGAACPGLMRRPYHAPLPARPACDRLSISIEKETMPARSTNRDDFQTVPRPIGAMAKDFPDGFFIAPHAHRRSQLIHASSGVMRVRTPQGAWIVPPHRAVWVPADIVHDVRMAGAVAMRTLYIEPEAVAALPRQCCVVAVSPLLRELILRASAAPLLYDEAGPDGRVMALILDELRVLPVLPLNLPMPQDARLAKIGRAILDDPADDLDLARMGPAGRRQQPHARAPVPARDRHDLRPLAPAGAADGGAEPPGAGAERHDHRPRSRL